ncbi:transmembrane protein 45A-like isoform X2 [Cricetulus griseus]|uniref:Transmembrane protein 45A-like isoform X2 n=1 Tax=Cricetulus griseus TaxID=10029 RepID=A0A9J7GV07_CRIGR|nr:transmembrane protein 45A-like isoform X2 [Cricetulus griseus]
MASKHRYSSHIFSGLLKSHSAYSMDFPIFTFQDVCVDHHTGHISDLLQFHPANFLIQICYKYWLPSLPAKVVALLACSQLVPGDFQGHALPGSFLIFLSLWWNSVNILKYVCKKQKQTYLHSKVWIRRAELLDGIILTGMVLFGAISLQIYSVSGSQLMWILRLHHTVIYIFYGILGVSKILGATINSFPASLTKLALSNAFFGQAFIMYNHTHGRFTMDVFLHKLLVLATFLSGLVSFMEILIKNNITLELIRASLIILQGTWLWQMGFVLYNPTGGFEWDLTDHQNNMLLTIYFCLHCIFAYITIGVNYAVITWLVKWRLRKCSFTQVPLLKATGQEQESEEM